MSEVNLTIEQKRRLEEKLRPPEAKIDRKAWRKAQEEKRAEIKKQILRKGKSVMRLMGFPVSEDRIRVDYHRNTSGLESSNWYVIAEHQEDKKIKAEYEAPAVLKLTREWRRETEEETTVKELTMRFKRTLEPLEGFHKGQTEVEVTLPGLPQADPFWGNATLRGDFDQDYSEFGYPNKNVVLKPLLTRTDRVLSELATALKIAGYGDFSATDLRQGVEVNLPELVTTSGAFIPNASFDEFAENFRKMTTRAKVEGEGVS